jgi:hypothetical protein
MSVQVTLKGLGRWAGPDDEPWMRSGVVMSCILLAVAGTVATSSRARTRDDGVKPARFVASYAPPAGDRAGDPVRGRAWTYDSAITAAGLAARGDLDGAGALLDALQDLQRPDGALEGSYDLAGGGGAGPLRAGNQAWVGLAALEWRARTCSGRHDRLIAGVARWLLAHRIADRGSPGYGLVRGGRDVSWASTEHNLEARAFFAGLAATLAGRPADRGTGRPCQPGLDGLSADAARALAAGAGSAVARIDRAIDAALLVLEGGGRAHLRQGLGDDARPLDAQALGILWLIGHGRRSDAQAVERTTDATMRVDARSVRWPQVGAQTFSGYRPFADAWGPDVLWMEGTLMMRLAKARLGSDVAALDDSADRWAALSAPDPPLQVDRAAGEDYHVWPAAAPAAWLALSRSRFALLQ